MNNEQLKGLRDAIDAKSESDPWTVHGRSENGDALFKVALFQGYGIRIETNLDVWETA